jgi:hypothetical protein
MTPAEFQRQAGQAIRDLGATNGHSFPVVTPFMGALGEAQTWKLVTRCDRCGQLVLINANQHPQPKFFGRKRWAPFHMVGLPVKWICWALANQSRHLNTLSGISIRVVE